MPIYPRITITLDPNKYEIIRQIAENRAITQNVLISQIIDSWIKENLKIIKEDYGIDIQKMKFDFEI